MKQLWMIVFVSTCLIFGCHSNKKGGHKAHGKKSKHSSVASSPGGSNGSGNSGNSISGTDTLKSSKNSKVRFGEGRPRMNSGGAMGVGTGGSYASNSYRRNILNRDEASSNRREYFKKRMEENDRIYFGEEVREDAPVIEQDTTSILEVDTEGFGEDSLIFQN